MTSEAAWERHVRGARNVVAGVFADGFGSLDALEPRLAAALGDLLSRPGSLVRATVAYLLGCASGLGESAARALAGGIEYLHTASLVFDDLPAMDDARMRRGAVCVHVAHGEGMALLAGLALINRGYAMLWQGIGEATLERRRAAAGWVERCLGVAGLVGGQALDLRGWRDTRDVAGVVEVAVRKTSSLLRLALVLPLVAGNGSTREVQLLDRVAVLRGIAYQIVDDLKDAFCGEKDSGKSAGRDLALGRPSMVEAEGQAGALVRLRRINDLAARVESKLLGAPERWQMLRLLRVEAPNLQAVAATA